MKKMDKKAFTLIELLVVIAVVGILVLLAAPRFIGYTQRAEDERIHHDIKVMEQEVGAVLINNEDNFNSWESNSKNLNQLAQDNELFEKKGPVAEGVKPIDGSYKVIPEKYKDKINTKLKGTFYANSDGKVYYEHVKPIDNKGYIPIATAEELAKIGQPGEPKYPLDGKYILTDNIDLSGFENWVPIGNNDSRFTGSFDGNGYKITGLTINRGQYVGLFGRVQGATISNVGLIANKVTGSGHYVGGLVGYAHSSTITNSYSTGPVTGTGSDVGGLVGRADSSTISNSYATGSVTSHSQAGGLVGYANGSMIENSYATGPVTVNKTFGAKAGGLVGGSVSKSKISNSYATGSVTGREYVGGLAGQIRSESTIENSYATGKVEGRGNYVGGLAGLAYDSTKISNSYATGPVTSTGTAYSVVTGAGGLVGKAFRSTISNSYATGSVKGPFANVGGLVGEVDEVTIENSYWDKETTKQITSSGQGESFGKTTEEMKKQTTYEGWNFDTVWEIDERDDYPKLR